MIMDYENKKTHRPQCANTTAIVELHWNPGEKMVVALH